MTLTKRCLMIERKGTAMNTPHATGKMWELFNGDCLHVMRNMAADSVHAVVTDPPYGLSFMGKGWDRAVPGPEYWGECLRVAKPGAHLLAFGGTRLFHRLACAIEDAGWEIRDCIMWVHGMGFPKSLNVSKAIDKTDSRVEQMARRYRFTEWVRSTGITLKQICDATDTNMGQHYTTNVSQPAIMTREHLEMCRHLLGDVPEWVERECDKRSVESKNFAERAVVGQYTCDMGGLGGERLGSVGGNITTPATDAAKQWDGWGTALKPAWEPIIVARKPFASTVAECVLQHGTGALNIDATRIPMGDEYNPDLVHRQHRAIGYSNIKSVGTTCGAVQFGSSGLIGIEIPQQNAKGRWPANVVHDGSDDVVRLMPDDGNGSAARFFYCAKADKTDRDEGLESMPLRECGALDGRADGSPNVDGMPPIGRNNHPTVKPNDLMRWCCRLVTPPDGIVFDPFMGSGSTGKAAIAEGFQFIGAELDAHFCDIAAARIGSAHNLFNA